MCFPSPQFSSVGRIPYSLSEGFDYKILPCAHHWQFKWVLQVRIEKRIPIQNNKTVTLITTHLDLVWREAQNVGRGQTHLSFLLIIHGPVAV